MKKWFDKKSSSNRDFSVGDLVLRWDKKHKDNKEYTKFQFLWLGPFIVIENIGPSTIQLQTLEGVVDTYPVNVFLLKKYFVWNDSSILYIGLVCYFLTVCLILVTFW